MSEYTDPTDLYEVPEDQRLDVDEDRDGLAEIEDLSAYRDALRGEVIELDGGGLESAGGFARYERSKSPCSGGPTPGANALVAYLVDRFPGTKNWGVYNCRNVSGTNEPSQHSEGRALDLAIPTKSGKARPEIGDPIVDLLRSEGRALGIQLLVYNRRKWGAAYPAGKPYGGKSPHYDHIHLSLTRDAAAKLNYATLEALLGGAGAVETVEVDGATHRVATESGGLNVRDQPTTSGSIVAELPKGTSVAVQTDRPQEALGHTWVKIKAGHRGQIIEGWVADGFLKAVTGAPAKATPGEAVSTAAGGATHRVATKSDDLRMRSQPTTSAEDNIIVEIPRGSRVTALSDAARHGDGHQWLKVRASVGGETHEGWVAMDLLQPLG